MHRSKDISSYVVDLEIRTGGSPLVASLISMMNGEKTKRETLPGKKIE